jgi:hypothetical protein
MAAADGLEVSRPMKNATAAISATRRSPAVAISHFGMYIGHALVVGRSSRDEDFRVLATTSRKCAVPTRSPITCRPQRSFTSTDAL